MSNGGHILRPIKEKEDNTKREPSEKSARKSLPLRPFPKWSMINLELVGPIGETIGNGRFEINWVEVCSFSHSSFASLSLERILYKFHSESGAESGAKMKGKLSPLPIFFPLLSLLLLSFDSTFSVFFFFSFLCVFFLPFSFRLFLKFPSVCFLSLPSLFFLSSGQEWQQSTEVNVEKVIAKVQQASKYLSGCSWCGRPWIAHCLCITQQLNAQPDLNNESVPSSNNFRFELAISWNCNRFYVHHYD